MSWNMRVAASLVAILLFSSTVRAGVTLVYPAPKTWVSTSDHLIIKLNDPQVTGIRISVNGIASDILQVGSSEYRKAFRDFVIVQPVWDAGKNDIVVETFNGPQALETQRVDIFYSAKKEASVPPEYKKMVFHSVEAEKICSSCHNVDPTPAQLTGTIGKDNPCYSCHKRMLSVKYVHGPAGTFSCGYCHDGKSNPRYSVPKRDAEVCKDCHDDLAKKFASFKYPHGPIAAGMCDICHDPHGSPFPSQLRAAVNDICLSCHDVVKKEPHVVRTPTGEGHVLSGKPDPSRPASGRELSCISCHDPHGANVRYFFQNSAENKMQLCQMCHNK